MTSSELKNMGINYDIGDLVYVHMTKPAPAPLRNMLYVPKVGMVLRFIVPDNKKYLAVEVLIGNKVTSVEPDLIRLPYEMYENKHV